MTVRGERPLLSEPVAVRHGSDLDRRILRFLTLQGNTFRDVTLPTQADNYSAQRPWQLSAGRK
jgi:hypothetical protein